ncbi:SDR family oxidoreductase [Hyphococcus sp. DH-69]|uniref:SDR family oxidoreductase n=1 Tax=Hyphococcus formosus TaxID=3143534 RepID=UPI00398ADA80
MVNVAQKRLFCIGYGYTAAALARILIGENWSIAGTTSREDKAATMRENGIEAIIWPDGKFNPDWIENATAILISVPPNEQSCPAFEATCEAILKHRTTIDWIGYLSTNGVYGNHSGRWVNEESALKPTQSRARRRIKAEAIWAEFGAAYSLPIKIFRLPGIYGPGRSALDNVRQSTAKRIVKPGQVFSRMHVDDIACALKADIEQPFTYDLFNLADDEPSPPHEVVEYACTLLGKDLPPLIPFEEADLSPMAKSFYADNKRVSNKRMKDALGVKLKYPTYREGLRAILESEEGTV